MQNKLAIRCQGESHGDRQGNILCAVQGNNIFIKCQDFYCRRWTKITINIPGLKLDLGSVGIVQESMPEDYHLHLEPATTAVSTK